MGKLLFKCAFTALFLGCVLFAAEEGSLVADDTDYKLLQTTSGFLGRHMEG